MKTMGDYWLEVYRPQLDDSGLSPSQNVVSRVVPQIRLFMFHL